jgi:hypothetical protein
MSDWYQVTFQGHYKDIRGHCGFVRIGLSSIHRNRRTFQGHCRDIPRTLNNQPSIRLLGRRTIRKTTCFGVTRSEAGHWILEPRFFRRLKFSSVGQSLNSSHRSDSGQPTHPTGIRPSLYSSLRKFLFAGCLPIGW